MKIPFDRRYAACYAKEIVVKEFPKLKRNFKIVEDRRKTGERMKELVVISGKGGTGKTTVTASLAALSKKRF